MEHSDPNLFEKSIPVSKNETKKRKKKYSYQFFITSIAILVGFNKQFICCILREISSLNFFGNLSVLF